MNEQTWRQIEAKQTRKERIKIEQRLIRLHAHLFQRRCMSRTYARQSIKKTHATLERMSKQRRTEARRKGNEST